MDMFNSRRLRIEETEQKCCRVCCCCQGYWDTHCCKCCLKEKSMREGGAFSHHGVLLSNPITSSHNLILNIVATLSFLVLLVLVIYSIDIYISK